MQLMKAEAKAEWQTTFPAIPGWYWAYQALPKDSGQAIFPLYVDENMILPGNIAGWYGPLTPPEIPDDYVPLEYREKENTKNK